MGAMISEDGGSTWVACSGGFEGTPAYEIRQNWRPDGYRGNQGEGTLYLATFGRGVFTSTSILSVDEYNLGSNPNEEQDELLCYPNPATNVTQIDFDSEINDELKIHVYSQTGQLILMVNTEVTKGNQVLTIPTSGLSQGLYFVRISGANGQYTSRFVK